MLWAVPCLMLVTNDRAGRDHYLQMFYVLAGGGVKGGTVIGQTDPTGAFTIDPGWSRGRDVRPEDIEGTIYSAMALTGPPSALMIPWAEASRMSRWRVRMPTGQYTSCGDKLLVSTADTGFEGAAIVISMRLTAWL